jgi:hypothetical protein
LRQRFSIDQQHYLNSLGGAYEYIEFNSNSKSGSFFFYSHDGKFMIKTQSPDESKFLRRILAHYYQYAMTHPHTYITRFYGMHRIKMPHLRRKIHFVVMQSVFYGDHDIHEMYDLKGSTVGRAATEKEKARGPDSCVYKDQDLIRSNTKLKLGPGRRDAFLEQIRQDAQFLNRMQIMDYSLLLGIHYRSQRDTAKPHALVHTAAPMVSTTSLVTGIDSPGDGVEPEETDAAGVGLAGAGERSSSLPVLDEGPETDLTPPTHMRGGSSFGDIVPRGRGDGRLPLRRRLASADDSSVSELYSPDAAIAALFSPGQVMHAALGDANRTLRAAADRSAHNMQTLTGARGGGVTGIRDEGASRAVVEPPHETAEAGLGIFGIESDGVTMADEIYYLGIIDILQQYDLRKRGETMLKAIYQPVSRISAVSPEFYAKRFVEFLREHTQ